MTATGLSITTGAGISGVQHLAQSVAIILGTPVGTRVMRRDFGSLLPQLLDQPDNAATRVRLYAAVAGALLLLGPALLKSRLGVDEVVTTLLLNFIVLLLVSYYPPFATWLPNTLMGN